MPEIFKLINYVNKYFLNIQDYKLNLHIISFIIIIKFNKSLVLYLSIILISKLL